MTTKYSRHTSTKQTPQTEPIPGKAMVPNSAGGFTYQLDDWGRLDRFLILGTEGGTYYASEKKITLENAKVVERCIKADGVKTVTQIAAISDAGRAPKNDPAIFALALCLAQGDEKTRRAARTAVPRVCRIGTHIFQLAESIEDMRGWGSLATKAVHDWYTTQQADQLAMNVVKYRNRNNWTHKDLIRQGHVVPHTAEHSAVVRWVVRDGNLDPYQVIRPKGPWPMLAKKYGVKKLEDLPPEAVLRVEQRNAIDRKYLPKVIEGFELAQKPDLTVGEAVKLITDYGLPRECIPTTLLNDPRIWEALLMTGRGMPFTAMIRNLAKMTAVGLLAPLSDAMKFVVNRLGDKVGMKKARVHPVAVLLAEKVYASGAGVKGDLRWTPVQKIVDALDDAFYAAFEAVEPTGKNYLLGVDVSGSMSGGGVAGTPLTPCEGAGAMALVCAKTEPWTQVMGFAHDFRDLKISPKMRLDAVTKRMQDQNFGATDCALPMQYALLHNLKVDVFQVYTDNETYAGRTEHPSQALDSYRQKTGINAKLVVVGMTATGFTIADPNDAGMLDVVGFDAAAPVVMADFARG